MRSEWRAVAAYTAIALVATWPLVLGLGRDVAWDLGDSLLNMWILAWDGEQILAVLSGDVSRLATFFDANIFHPAPLTLAYSEHLLPQAIQILPIYAVTRNPILSYNLLFLSTFVLSGLGMYLLVRELTGRPAAAFVAGLLFAFAPYRIPQSSHLQVLSSQWMPFVLYGLHRYFAAVEEGRTRLRPLAGAAAALILQSLSCGYYLLYFSPFAAGYALWRVAQHRLWRQWKVWAQLAAAAASVLAVTAPFLLPYAVVTSELRFERSRAEVVRFSADVYSYATSFVEQPLWGSLIRGYAKPEGDLFPGFVTLLLAAIGVWAAVRMTPGGLGRPAASALTARDGKPRRRLWRRQEGRPVPAGDPPILAGADNQVVPGRWELNVPRFVPVLLVAACVAHLAAAAAGLIYRRLVLDLWLFELQISNVNQMLLRAAVSVALLLALSSAARMRARALAQGPGYFLGALIVAMWLSLGPEPQVQGRPVEIAAPYGFLYDHVPGFEGVRAPARLAMIAVLMLSVLGGFGAAYLSSRRRAPVWLAGLSVAFLAESLVLPFTVNGVSATPGYNLPEARVYRPQRAPNIYKEFVRQAPGGVLAELPLGESDFDLRALYYSTAHWRPLLNGYSGYYPPHYGRLALALSDVPRFPGPALEALHAHGATHVIVHEGAFIGDRGVNTSAVLLAHGARELYREGPDVLLGLPETGTGVAP
jgi:hypothetical protein